jgi:hypothetical protein
LHDTREGCEAAAQLVKDVLESIDDTCPECPPESGEAASTLILYGWSDRPSAGEFSPGHGEIEPFLTLQAISCDGELHSRIRFALGIVFALYTGKCNC